MTATGTVAADRARRLPVAEASALLLVAAAAWLGTVAEASGMGAMPGTMGLGLIGFVGVWALMMGAMMLPSVTPFALLYMRTITDRRTFRLVTLIAGYLLVWAAVGVPAYGLAGVAGNVADHHAGFATATAVTIFALCGLYQLTPIKERCLVRCRSPLGELIRYSSRTGRAREFRIGVRHGAYCFGCCWALMGLLLAFGVMNVTAMVALAAVILVEKRLPQGRGLARFVGVGVLGLAVAAIWAPGLAPGLHAAGHSMSGM